MRIDQRQRILAIIAVAVVALFALNKMVFNPVEEAWRNRSARLTKLQKSIEQGSMLIQRESHTRKMWNEIRKSTLPVDASQAETEMFGAFEKWSADSRVSISSIRRQWKRGATDDYSVVEYRVDAAGNLSTLAKFLYNIETSPIAVKMESVEFTARDNNGDQIALGLLVSAVRLAGMDAK